MDDPSELNLQETASGPWNLFQNLLDNHTWKLEISKSVVAYKQEDEITSKGQSW